MSSALFMARNPKNSSVLKLSDQRGRWTLVGGCAISRQSLPTDSIGLFNLSLVNVVVGSSVQIETLAGEVLQFLVTTNSVNNFVLPAFFPGSPNNNLVIKVRKGSSAPFFQPFETQATAVVGSQSIFVSQIPDE